MLQNPKLSEQRGVTGNHFFDFLSCTTRLWLSNKRINVGLDNEHIMIGNYIDEKTKPRSRKRLIIQGLCSIDYIEEKSGIEVHEVKKGRTPTEPHYFQLLFYMQIIYELTEKEPLGFLHLPQVRKVVKVIRDEKKVYDAYNEIVKVLSGPCPKPKLKPICVGCSFMEMCWA
ncbi:Dna2/Cas4 domain-containing protein [Oxyplasma meridianum]|uniref:Dna2/Cas4 domain-containing protein n=1 Tax=Oxyplasma meridianum TaxID=3073602 RepID=A0AAX4NDR9_9ARCH